MDITVANYYLVFEKIVVFHIEDIVININLGKIEHFIKLLINYLTH